MTQEIEKAMEAEIAAASVDERGHQQAGARKAARRGEQDRLPGQVARLQLRARSRAAISSATSSAPSNFESRRQLAKIGKPVDRAEWQMTPPTVNAYYDPQMNDINFPGRRAAAAAVRSEDGRRAELRQHRRHHRPRADARLRRRRPPVRRQGQSEGLVDQEGRRRIRASAPSASPISTRNTPWWTISRSTAS